MTAKLQRPGVIQVGFKKGVVDSLGNIIRRRIIEDLKIADIERVRTIDVYTIDKSLSTSQLRKVQKELLTDPVIQRSSLNRNLSRPGDFDWLAEIGYKHGVTDNSGRTAAEAIEDLLGIKFEGGEAVYTSRQYLFKGKLAEPEVERICRDLLANDLIERWMIFSSADWNGKIADNVPKVESCRSPNVNFIDLEVGDSELLEISRRGVLALNLEEMKAIKDYYRRPDVAAERKQTGLPEKPSDVEIEALAQTWSEHCKHKIFNALISYQDENGKRTIDSLFSKYIKGSTDEIARRIDFLVSVFKDNAGVIKFNDGWNIVLKVETHNAPSALDPYGGALTGIVGVNRDPMGTGLGAKLIFNTDVFCFASPFYSELLPPRVLHPKRVFEGVRRGVEHGGNKSGIPTVNGTVYFDDRFMGKPLVYCGTGGIMPAMINGEPSHIKKARDGDLIVMTGGRIGKDGIHGATFSSEELHELSPTSAVQIGDPITQKKMYDFLLEARDLGLYTAVTDNGAGGLSSSVGEMAQLSGGCEIHLEKAPLKYAGLDPWEILLSEAQERMTLAVPCEKIDQFLALAEKRGVEATVLGKFTGSGKFHVLYEGKTVAYLDMKFLHEGVPQMKLEAIWEPHEHIETELAATKELKGTLEAMLSRLNICSKEYVVRQYDHEVQGGSVVKPLVGINNDGPSDAAVIRPLLDSFEGVIVANGINPRYSDIDTYHMAACAIDEAIRNTIAVGGSLTHIALNDNFCWPSPLSEKNPDGKYKLAQLVRANMALYDFTTAFNTPCISGKDSMSIDYKYKDENGVEHKISGPPTLLITAIGKIGDVRKAVTMDIKASGDLIYILGITRHELGGSEYCAMLGFTGNSVPEVDARGAKKLYKALSKAIESELVASCHDVSNGGSGVALAESALAGGLGMEIDLRKVPVEGIDRDDVVLFSESQSRFIVTVSPANQAEFEKTMEDNTYAQIGRVREDDCFTVTGLNGEVAINADIRELKEAWQRTLRW